MDMAVSELAGAITFVRLQGRMDAVGAGRIDLPFTASVVAVGRNAVIDLGGVTFIASMGIRLLISAARGLHGKGARLALLGAAGMVRTVLDEAAIDQIIPLVDTEEQALRALAA